VARHVVRSTEAFKDGHEEEGNVPEWFSNPRPNLYVSDEGFSVEVLGRTGMRYREAGREAFIDSEAMSTPDTMLAYSGSIKKWDPPHESETLDDNDRERIIENAKKAFEFYGFTLRVL
jgi:immunity protein 74 of polymorphic toxin system